MKGYTINKSIDLLESEVEKIQNIPATVPTAADISYDNTSSHLTADDVQEAIDELNTAISSIDPELDIPYSTTEQKIGTWTDGSDVYQKVIHFEEAVSIALDSAWHSTGITLSDIDTLIDLRCLGGFVWNIVSGFLNSGVLTLTSIVAASGGAAASITDIVLVYTKVSQQSKKKKSK